MPGPLNHFLPPSAEKTLLFYTRNLIFFPGIVESCISHSGAECNRPGRDLACSFSEADILNPLQEG
jgi:hypothetical protein